VEFFVKGCLFLHWEYICNLEYLYILNLFVGLWLLLVGLLGVGWVSSMTKICERSWRLLNQWHEAERRSIVLKKLPKDNWGARRECLG
jgi:hypothetical protein